MGIKAKKTTAKKDKFENKDIIQIIFDLMPKKRAANGKKIKLKNADLALFSKQAAKIFEACIDYIIRSRDVMPIRNHIIIEKKTYDELRSKAMQEGAKIGAQTTCKRFNEKSLGKRLRCAFTGRID